MCFIKTSSKEVAIQPAEEKETVARREADASITKSSVDSNKQGFKQNLKTSAIGLGETAETEKKTLLGE